MATVQTFDINPCGHISAVRVLIDFVLLVVKLAVKLLVDGLVSLELVRSDRRR